MKRENAKKSRKTRSPARTTLGWRWLGFAFFAFLSFASFAFLLPTLLPAQAGPGGITTFAGKGNPNFSGDGGPAAQARLNFPRGVAVDAKGVVYIADTGNHRVRRVGLDGIITTFAGTDTVGFSGDGGAAAQASLYSPFGVAVDTKGAVYIADTGNERVRRVGLDGTTTTFARSKLMFPGSKPAGMQGRGLAGNRESSLPPPLFLVVGVAVDVAGAVYIADGDNHRLFRIDPNGAITTFAGKGTGPYTGSFSGDGGAAVQASLNNPYGVAVDAKGNVYVADRDNHRIRRVGPDGIITTFAGKGDRSFSGDGGPATQASLYRPTGVAVDDKGNVYIADAGNHRIRRVGPDGFITTFAGTGTEGFSGDRGPATEAQLFGPSGVAVDAKGNVYIADAGNDRIRRVSSDGIITTIAGGGSFLGDGGPAIQAILDSPIGVAVDARGNVYIADAGNDRIRLVGPDGVITTFAGTGSTGYGKGGFSGDGGPATQARLWNPSGVAVDAKGNVYIADAGNDRIRLVGLDGVITTFAGTEEPGFSGDGGPAAQARLNWPSGVAVDARGNVYIADHLNSRIRRVGLDGAITTFAGTGKTDFSGNGGPATQASLKNPYGVAVDAKGVVYIADTNNQRIRRVGLDGIITTFAGGGGSLGDGRPATQVAIRPTGVAIDVKGNVYIADTDNNRIHRVGADGTITTVAGSGPSGFPQPIDLPEPERGGFSGDGGSATQARLNSPYGVAVDVKGNIYIADLYNHRIRRVEGISAPISARHRAIIVVTVIRDGTPAAGLEVAFSRSVSGLPPDYKWKGRTDADGRVKVEIVADAGQGGRTGATGYYRARATDPASGQVVGQWGSIPINGGKEITLSLPIGGQARIEGQRALPEVVPLTLYPNYPNPFNPITQIAYELLEGGEVSLVVYNLLGQQVRVLVQGFQEAGYYRVTWDGKDAYGRSVSSGLYLYRLASRGLAQTGRMLLLK